MSYVIGLDLGTSSLKGLILDRSGNIVFEKSISYPVIHDVGGLSEQDPQDWLNACDDFFYDLYLYDKNILHHLDGISFSGQMHSLVLLDKDKRVLRNAILWNDTRTTSQCKEINRFPIVLKKTHNIALEGFTLPKVLWVKENEPEIWEKVRYLLLPKDYLRYYLTGKINMEFSDASGTLMLDIEKKEWSKDILDLFEIPESIMPSLISSVSNVGTLTNESKSRYKIEHPVKVFAGGADNACAAIGAGIFTSNVGLCSIGTSGVILHMKDKLGIPFQTCLHTFLHAIPDKYYTMGVTLSAGDSLSWFRSNFSPETDFSQLLKKIDSVPTGSNGLLFTPYLSGERCPHTDASIKGAFIGISHQHTLIHFLRSVIEGITFSLKDTMELMESQGLNSFDKIISVGGGSKSEIWLQIQANVFDKTVTCLKKEQGPAFGAALIAMVGLKWYDTFEVAFQVLIQEKQEFHPQNNKVSTYNEAFDRYKKIYQATLALNKR